MGEQANLSTMLYTWAPLARHPIIGGRKKRRIYKQGERVCMQSSKLGNLF